MSQGLVMAGLAAAAFYLLSPKLRRSVNGFLEQLAAEERRKRQLLEAERRAAIISGAFKSFEFQPEPTPELPPAPPAKLAFPAVAEPDAQWAREICNRA